MPGVRMQQRRAIKSVWDTSDYVLAAGEIGVETDTGIIKVGDGTTPWTSLDPIFSSHYLPILGKAADSNLLDGVDSTGYVKIGDPVTTATNNTIAKRTATGQLVAATAIASGELTTLAQQTAAISAAITAGTPTIRSLSISRTLTAAGNIASGDAFSTVLINSATNPTAITLPSDATDNVPIGSWVIIQNIHATARVTVAAGAGATFDRGQYPSFMLFRGDTIRVLKTAANTWVYLEGVRDSGWIDTAAILASGWTKTADGSQYRMRNGVVTIASAATNTSGSTKAAASTFLTLPTGFAPAQIQWPIARKFDGSVNEFKITTGGVASYGGSIENTTGFVVTATFLAA